ncbi:hypothetical protein KGD82_07795 [Nocardiopsis eucommiae]|uniref:Uncharacterized protein n=1 Tax=Nocardiopsis eucommiae TaxID=2831970 RepID=A0A975LCG8_9ACTN|nr:hypothetical protein KGD82_07795 [Nocardiopsis eucommiae]
MNDTLVALVVWAVLTLFAASLTWEMVRSARTGEGARAFPDRGGVVRRSAGVVLLTAYILLAVGWLHLPAALWWVNAALAATALGAGAARWRTLPWSAAEGGARARWIGAVFTVGLTVALVLLLAL